MALTERAVVLWIASMRDAIFWVADAVCAASAFTSCATTAKPRPVSPARAHPLFEPGILGNDHDDERHPAGTHETCTSPDRAPKGVIEIGPGCINDGDALLGMDRLQGRLGGDK